MTSPLRLRTIYLDRPQTRLADARPGDVLLDADGDEWVRRRGVATMLPTRTNPRVRRGVRWSLDEFPEAEENFGPFTLHGRRA